jgi:hypothetical protein
MWVRLPFRKRVEVGRVTGRRRRLNRPRCTPLEDRVLLSVSLTDTAPPIPYVGSPVVWTATASGHGTSPVYQFSVERTGGASYVVRDFSTSNTFTWNPMEEGTYVISVTVEDSFGASSTAETAGDSYTAVTRIVGNGAVITPMSNPLVALYSAPPSSGTSMYVEFSAAGPNPSWQSTAPLPIVPGESTNFIVAGMLPNTTYLMRDVVNDGTVSAPLEFTTGSLPTNLTFPTFSVTQAAGPGTDLTEDTILHFGLAPSASTVGTLATDLSGNIVWYFDPVANNYYSEYGTTLAPGGTVLLFGQSSPGAGGATSSLREIDLAGDALRETNVNAVDAQLAAMNLPLISDFNHDIQILPNGDLAILANSPRTINVNGTPTLYDGSEVLVLNQSLQVTWVWDPFQWLNTSRLGTDGEGPNDWLHANSISWSPDGNLIVSLRAQDWVIKIDYANGTGDGHIIWTLGAGGDFTITDATDPSDPYPWFSHQHDVRCINVNTIVLFDDGNTRHDTTSSKDSRGQELILNTQTMTATLVVNSDLGNYSAALGSAQLLPSGDLAFTSGLLGSASGPTGQSIEVLPNGTKTYVQQMTGLFEYRAYFMSSLYGPGSVAEFLTPDSSTQGRWIGSYGAQGYDVVGGPASLPSYATITASGESSWTWAANTTDSRALQVPGSAGGIAACWYSDSSFSVDVNLTDGRQHNLALYFLDWESNARAEQVQITDAATGLVLSTQSISSFQNGLYLDYAVSGRIIITITRTAGANAVLSGLFLDPPPTATFLRQDATTQGAWIGTYGTQGYDVIGSSASLPGYASVTPSGESSGIWASSTNDPRALQVPGGTGGFAGYWGSTSSFTVDVNLTDGHQHNLELYFVDWDSTARAEQVQISDPATGLVLSTQSISSFQNGLYLDYAVSGHIIITITRTGGTDAVLSGLFLDPPPAATFLQQDATTQGAWTSTYGSQGYDLIGSSASLPSYATITPSKQASYTWASSTTDPRALVVPGGTTGIAACWFSNSSFTVDVNLTDGQQHDLELYFVDWDNTTRVEQVQISNAATGQILSTQSISSFHDGLYLDYAVTGHITITFTRIAGPNAVLSGLFLDSPPTTKFLRQDTTTGGTWIGTYGTQGYDVIGGSASLPGYATVTPSGEASWTWASPSSDPRALQVPGGTGGIAACWYSASSFTVDVNLTDGRQHNLELYFVDWVSNARAEQVQISDAATGQVISTQSISSFHNGLYLDYAVTGNIVITITRTGGANAVLSGLFLG